MLHHRELDLRVAEIAAARAHHRAEQAVGASTIPVRPGRNITTLVEVAARNHLLKLQGHHSAKEFAEQLNRAIAEGAMRRTLGEEVE